MDLRRHKAMAALVFVLAAAPVSLGLFSAAASAQDTTTSTTLAPTSTTLAPTTTTVASDHDDHDRGADHDDDPGAPFHDDLSPHDDHHDISEVLVEFQDMGLDPARRGDRAGHRPGRPPHRPEPQTG